MFLLPQVFITMILGTIQHITTYVYIVLWQWIHTLIHWLIQATMWTFKEREVVFLCEALSQLWSVEFCNPLPPNLLDLRGLELAIKQDWLTPGTCQSSMESRLLQHKTDAKLHTSSLACWNISYDQIITQYQITLIMRVYIWWLYVQLSV